MMKPSQRRVLVVVAFVVGVGCGVVGTMAVMRRPARLEGVLDIALRVNRREEGMGRGPAALLDGLMRDPHDLEIGPALVEWAVERSTGVDPDRYWGQAMLVLQVYFDKDKRAEKRIVEMLGEAGAWAHQYEALHAISLSERFGEFVDLVRQVASDPRTGSKSQRLAEFIISKHEQK